MAKYKDPETGEEVEAFSQEEFDTKVAEAQAAADAKLAEKDTAMASLQKERDDAKLALEEAANKGGRESENYKTLKAALDLKDQKLNEVKTEMETIKGQRIEDIKNSVLDQVAGKDPDLRKKIEHHFNETLKGVTANTPEEIKAKLENAKKLSIEVDNPNPLDTINNGGGPGVQQENDGKGLEFTSREKTLGGKLGIGQEDYKKYGDDPRLKNMLNK
jgi:chromosome segregation ATPase